MRFAGQALDSANYISAAQSSGKSLGGTLASKAPRYDALSNAASVTKAEEKISAINSQANVQNAGIRSMSDLKNAQLGAESTLAQAEASASATRTSGMMDMFGSIAGGALGALKPKFDYGKTKIGAGGGVVGGYGTLGPNYGIKQ